MSGFGFSEAQEMFRKEIKNFLKKEIAPGARQRAKLEHIPEKIWRAVADYGLLRFNAPEKYGGQPVDWVSVGILMEEITRVDFCLYHPILMTLAINQGLAQGSEQVQAEWFPPILSGEKIACLALTEPEAGSDAANIRTRARRDGGYYILEGEKTSITQGNEARVAMLFAKTDPSQKARGVSCFMVPLDAPGVHRSRLPCMGYQPVASASIILEGVRVPQHYLVGGEGQGFYIVMRQFDFMRLMLGLVCLGAAQASLEEAIEYAKTRKAFGQPLAKFEGISFKIAEHYTRLEAARLLCYRGLYLKDQGQPHTREAAMVKWWCPQVAIAAVHDCLLIHGHYGYSEELPLEQCLRNLVGLEIGDGTAQIMKVIIPRELLGREFLPY